MGFLGFLKKGKKKESLDNLDLPPAPPPSRHEDDSSKQFMPPHERKGHSQKPPSLPQEDLPPEMPLEFKDEVDIPPSQLRDEFHIPEMPVDLPPISGSSTKEFSPPKTPSQDVPPPPKKVPSSPAPEVRTPPRTKKPLHEIDHAEPQSPSYVPDHHPEQPHRRIVGNKPVYFKIDKFTAVMSGLNDLRANLRRTDAVLAEITTTFQHREKDYTKWRSSLMDIKKKLMFVDKTMFKGDKQ